MIYKNCRDGFLAKKAETEAATTAKNEALEDLIEAMKADIFYAENTVNFDNDKLKLIGWAGKRAKTPLAPPGQVRLLEASNKVRAGFIWTGRRPSMVARPKAYKIQRRFIRRNIVLKSRGEKL